MRVLTLSERHSVSGTAFIEGYVFDDCAVWGAAIGLTGALGLGVYAPHCYNKPLLSLKNIANCVLYTAAQGIIYGLLIDATLGVFTAAKNTLF